MCISLPFNKQERMYYAALKKLQRQWEALNPGDNWLELLDLEKRERLQQIMELLESWGVPIGDGTTEWDVRTAERRAVRGGRMDGHRTKTNKPYFTAFDKARMECRVIQPAT